MRELGLATATIRIQEQLFLEIFIEKFKVFISFNMPQKVEASVVPVFNLNINCHIICLI